MPGTKVPGILPFMGIFFTVKIPRPGTNSSGRVYIFFKIEYSIHSTYRTGYVFVCFSSGHPTAAQAFFSPVQRNAEISAIAFSSSSPSIITSTRSPETASRDIMPMILLAFTFLEPYSRYTRLSYLLATCTSSAIGRPSRPCGRLIKIDFLSINNSYPAVSRL